MHLAPFQNILSTVLKDDIDKSVLVPLDDILVYIEHEEEHHNHSKFGSEVAELQLLGEHQLSANMAKRKLKHCELQFLEHSHAGSVAGVHAASPGLCQLVSPLCVELGYANCRHGGLTQQGSKPCLD